MKRSVVAVAVAVAVVVVAASVSCAAASFGKICVPADDNPCGDGLQCVSFCDGETVTSICVDSPATDQPAQVAAATVSSAADVAHLAHASVVSGDVNVAAHTLSGVALSVLATIGGGLRVATNNGALTCAAFDALTSVTGDVVVDDNAKLATLTAPLLHDVHGLQLSGGSSLAELALNSVVAVGAGGVVINGGDGLKRLKLESLERVDGPLVITGSAYDDVGIDRLQCVSQPSPRLDAATCAAASLGCNPVADGGGTICGDGANACATDCP